jgi:hypothetical protein
MVENVVVRKALEDQWVGMQVRFINRHPSGSDRSVRCGVCTGVNVHTYQNSRCELAFTIFLIVTQEDSVVTQHWSIGDCRIVVKRADRLR